MINQYSPWAELASLPHLKLLREPPGDGLLGDYDDRSGVIRLDPRMPRRQARSVLCHEIRHHEAADVATDCVRTTLRQEFLADTRAARLLVDCRDLADAMIIHDQVQSAVSVELGVSLDVVQVRLKHLWRLEWDYLRRRLA